MALLDLPSELLTLIAEYVGVSELRKSVAYLLVAKRWCCAVLPVYLSHLPLSNLYLASHHDLERLPPSDTALSKLIQAKVSRLSLRLVGHPSKRPSLNPWHDNSTPWSEVMDLDDLDDDLLDGTKKLKHWHYDWMTAGPVKDTSGGGRWRWHQEQRVLYQWGKSVNRKMVDLAAILSAFKSLEEFSLEASSEYEGREGPRWDYLQDSTMHSLISSLPPSLNNLTLDMCGSKAITSERGRNPIHLCPLIAERLRDFRNVRLRLRCICSEVLNPPPLTPTPESRLKTLVIKLSLPFFLDSFGGKNEYNTGLDVEPCSVERFPLYKTMFAAGAEYANRFPGVSMLRISHRWQSDTKSPKHNSETEVLAVADCVRKRYMFDPSGAFCHEDDGSGWDAWEESEDLRESGSSEEYFRMKYRTSHTRPRHDDLFEPGLAQSSS